MEGIRIPNLEVLVQDVVDAAQLKEKFIS